MTDIDTLCLNCLCDKGSGQSCSRCGFDESHSKNTPIALPLRNVLNERFLIGRILGQPGGFGITYLAWDMVLDTPVAIKEFMPTTTVNRIPGLCTVQPNSEQDAAFFDKGLDIFLAEAKTLAQFSHPNIVRVKDFFRANNTAYMVMEYHQGVPLDEYVKNHGGRLKEDDALAVILPILDGLQVVHRLSILHRDIKPKNIYITQHGNPLLLDFGAARLSMLDATNTLTVMLSRGFAPFEQYHQKGLQGPWTDIYACAATLYYMVTGEIPADAIERRHQDSLIPPIRLNASLRESFNLSIIKGLAVNKDDRPQNVAQFKQSLLSTSQLDTTVINVNAATSTSQIKTQLPVGLIKPRQANQPKKADSQRKTSNSGGLNLGKLALIAVIGIPALLIWMKKAPKLEQPVSQTASFETTTLAATNNVTQNNPTTSTEPELQPQATPEILAPAPEPKTEIVEEKLPEIAAVRAPQQKVIIIENASHQEKPPSPTGSIPNHTYQQPPPIPPMAYQVCSKLSNNADCNFPTPFGIERGRCLLAPPQNNLACIPLNAPPPPRM